MSFPTLFTLPLPPPNHNGWPWTEMSPKLPDTTPDGSPWPRISIVTPSFNQGQFIEETIRSVLLQGYPSLEYIIMDGGSTDNSVEIIRKYEPWLTYWESKPDGGQADALIKGFAIATGDILGWINSDDLLGPRALEPVASAWQSERPCLVTGLVIHFRSTITTPVCMIVPENISYKSLLAGWCSGVRWHQPGIYMHTSIYRRVGGIDPLLHIAMDYDLYLRMLQQDDRIAYIGDTVAFFREHAGSKTMGATALSPSQAKEYLYVILKHRVQFTHSEWFTRLWSSVHSTLRRAAAACKRGQFRIALSNIAFASSVFLRIIASKLRSTAKEQKAGLS